MTIDKIKKLIQTENYRWLFSCAKPFSGHIIALILIDGFTTIVGVGSVVISKYMVDNAIAGNSAEAINYIIIFVGIQIFGLAMGVVTSKIGVKLSEKMSYALEQDTIQRVFKKQWLALNHYHSGDIISRLLDDTGSVVSLWTSTIPGMVTLGLQLIVAFSILFYYDRTLALLAFILGPFAVIFSFILGQKKKKLQRGMREAESRYRSYIIELIQHILIVKSFQYEKESIQRVSDRQGEKYNYALKKNNLSIKTKLIVSGGYYLGYVLAFVYGVSQIARGVSFGTFTVFIQLVSQVQSPIMGLTKSFSHIISSFASVDRLIELQDIDNEAENECYLLNGSEVDLIIKNVAFGYYEDRDVLSNLHFKAQHGKITALIGSSGEGKTTIMRLLLGLIKPRTGEVVICEKATQTFTVSASTREFFTYVPQGNTLFSGTVTENLRVGKPDATVQELETALRAACAYDFVMALPDKLEASLCESGVGISEGQAQRLCIARALIRKAPILLLDEATSALDMETEKRIFENIRALNNKTCIVITHRLSVLPLCDTVFRLESGSLYEHSSADFTDFIEKEKIS